MRTVQTARHLSKWAPFFLFLFPFFKAHKHCGFHSFHNRDTSVIPETVEMMSTAQYAMRHLVDLEGESHHHTEKCTVARHYTTCSAAGSRRAHMTVTFAHRGSSWSSSGAAQTWYPSSLRLRIPIRDMRRTRSRTRCKIHCMHTR